jgi:hypothetical protein
MAMGTLLLLEGALLVVGGLTLLLAGEPTQLLVAGHLVGHVVDNTLLLRDTEVHPLPVPPLVVVLSARGNIIVLPILLLKLNPQRSWGTAIKASRRGSARTRRSWSAQSVQRTIIQTNARYSEV